MKHYWRLVDGDTFHGTFDTPEEAIADANEHLSNAEKIPFVIGEAVEGRDLIRKIVGVGYADLVIDALGEQASDICGEASDDWPYPGYNDPERAALDNMLEPILIEWIENCSPPSFWWANTETERVISE